ncbi:MAG: succinate dehydrogenase, cytochrome b556 subunit [Alphaproteobacteria bacterium]|jgi:fumarate reductase subunit D|nr:succinate dehydrogenase, cytochrome b556 subunit [Alphaproteobacteria bacterium]MDP6563240.1 succinate dehydrogenase, cytochrome b556 subunit [Alphaproteobacteria bacterium]MDP6814888.1 succinate dehydrogenase, cytochrome b556 subunit [Alphaproteobacteria bacterium]
MTALVRHRGHPAYWAFLLHRLSGLLLALFLPAHFLVLGLALDEGAAFGAFIAWSEQPLVKLSEWLLLLALALHLTGGLRLLALEFLPWSERQKALLAASFGGAALFGAGFLFALV